MNDRRQFQRFQCDIEGEIESPSFKIPCRINNITKIGLGGTIRPGHVLRVGQKITIHIGEVATKPSIVRWLGSGKYGLEFRSALSSRELSMIVEAQAA